MRLAQIENGIIVNVIEVDQKNRPDWSASWPDAGEAGPGWVANGKAFAPPVESPAPLPEPDPVLAALELLATDATPDVRDAVAVEIRKATR